MSYRDALLHGWLSLILVISTLACCKEHCEKERLNTVYIGFNTTEIDTILLRKFKPGGVFLEKTDSFYFHINTPLSDSIHAPVYNGVQLDHDYEIYLPAAARTFRLSAITTRKEDCTCGSGRRKIILTYTLDGRNLTGEDIYLKKKYFFCTFI